MICHSNHWKYLWLVVCLALPALAGLAQEGTPAQEVKWRFDYNVARKEAQDRNLPLVIDFGTKTCRFCVLLDQTTFRDSKVVGVMNERFIPLKVDAEVGVGMDLANHLQISSYPTIVLAGPDLKILHTIVGYKDAGEFHEYLQRVLATITTPEWMQRDLLAADKLIQSGNYAGAIAALKPILEDGKGRLPQAGAEKLIKEMEQKAAERLVKAKEMQDKGQYSEAVDYLGETQRIFPGLLASRNASEMAARIIQSPEIRAQQRGKRARDLLTQAKEFFKNREFVACLDRCEWLMASYGDLPEGQEASLIVAEFKSNPDWLQTAADSMSDRLGGLYLALADAHLKKSQPQQAEIFLQRVIHMFPGSRQSEAAQIRLAQMQGLPTTPAPPRTAGPP